jgi:hypothetical protein
MGEMKNRNKKIEKRAGTKKTTGKNYTSYFLFSSTFKWFVGTCGNLFSNPYLFFP